MKRRVFLQSSLAAGLTATLSGKYLPALGQGDKSALASIDAVRHSGEKITLQGSRLQELRDALYGALLLPQDDGYENARRVFNPNIDKRPALIVQAAGVADVRLAVDFARDNGLLLAVKCGGHSYSGQSTCNGGMMIDLSPMRNVRVDPVAKRAHVSGGTLLGQVDYETIAHGLAVPLGTFPGTGVGGLATGGGFGRLGRRWGLTLDNIRSVDVVTADGKLVYADERQNSDLLWAVRGAGGNFGIVTNFEFELHPLSSPVIAGPVRFPLSEAAQVLAAYADYSATAPDELYMEIFLSGGAAAADGTATVKVCYSGDERSAEKALQPIRRFGTVLEDKLKSMSYVRAQGSNIQADARVKRAQLVTGAQMYVKSGFTAGINADLVKAIVQGMEHNPKRYSGVAFQPAGGAIGRVANSATAFAHRYASHIMMSFISWPLGEESADHMRYASDRWQDLDKHTRGFYTNDMTGSESSSTVSANYRENYPRLVQIKNKYDRGNLFRLNANVKPRVS